MSINTKKILGLDLGPNSIGWALIEQNFEEKYGRILGMGCRIIPMSKDTLTKFGEGNSVSQTAERTKSRSARRLRERHLLRRERMHRVFNILGFLPKHYAAKIDFDKRLGKFTPETETKLAYDDDGQFIFKESFDKMLEEFKIHQPELLNRKNKKGEDAKIPYDWTIYYLRKKALTQKIENEELAWLLLHFNQKRGYYQLRGEETEDKSNKLEEFYTLKVIDVTADEKKGGKAEVWYNIILENGWIYRRASKLPLYDWKGKTRDFIVTTDLKEDGSIKKDKDGQEKRSFRAPKEDDWQLLKKRTESEIGKSEKTVGTYIYDTLLQKPIQKIRGKLVRTIERKYYKEELRLILQKQIELNTLLQDKKIYQQCVEELYPHNLSYQTILTNKDFLYLFVEDILYYQRPLRSQKGAISNCPLEVKVFIHNGVKKNESLKCIPKSHPLYQEFRLWQWISNLRIFNKDTDLNETALILQSKDDIAKLFDFLSIRKEIDQKSLLKHFKLKESNYRWNYIEDKKYPCNETYSMIASRLGKIPDLHADFLTKDKEQDLWHIIYSVTDKIDYEKALKSFANKNNIDIDSFYEAFRRFPPFPSQYGAYSAKAIKKLLPLMRIGKYWKKEAIDDKTNSRINNIISGEYDETIRDRVRDKAINLSEISQFQGLPEWLAKYIVYDRHAERSDTGKWKNVINLEEYLQSFKQHSLKNPIVEQVLTEVLRTVKDIWNYYGNGAENFFDEIHIELGREMKNPAEKRKRLTEQATNNENTNLRIKALLAEMLNDTSIENVRPYSPMQQEILKLYEDAVLNDDIEIPDDILKISKMAQPTSSELQRYKLWLEQRYRSPYTGDMIPLSKLFTPLYEIEHIIPQSRYFDDSLNNKVICESAVNKLKDNQTGLQFIQNHHGQIVELGMGKSVTILAEDAYKAFVQQHYSKTRTKKNNLMSLDIPEKMIERQLNDTRYISKFVMQILSNIVREERNDEGINSKNILVTNGQITSKLRRDWGMDSIWNELILPRFERLNEITGTNDFTVYNERYQKYLPSVPLMLQKGFRKKRIDHRHHAMDAVIIACATRNHINYLNNQNTLDKRKSKDEKQKDRYDLKMLLCDKEYNDDYKENYSWKFKQPWPSFVPDAKEKLEKIVVSFKQNLRIINKSNNYYKKLQDGKEVFVKQEKGMSWAVRKPLHKDTPLGLVSLQRIKTVSLGSALKEPHTIVNRSLKRFIKNLIENGNDRKEVAKYFQDGGNIFEGNEVSKVEVFYWENDSVAKRVDLDSSFDHKRIASITDTGIQKILLKHLDSEQNKGKPELAFSPEGIEEMNINILSLNNGKFHQPILKVRICEAKGNKFPVGQTGNKVHKYVEAAKGTNLFFAIYVDEDGNRNFETIPLNIVVEREKQGLLAVPERNNKDHRLLFYLSPNDLVYVPEEESPEIFRLPDITDIPSSRFYRFKDSSETTANFVPLTASDLIFEMKKADQLKNGISYNIQNEFGLKSAQSKNQQSIDGIMIKKNCWKVMVDRLGNIKFS